MHGLVRLTHAVQSSCELECAYTEQSCHMSKLAWTAEYAESSHTVVEPVVTPNNYRRLAKESPYPTFGCIGLKFTSKNAHPRTWLIRAHLWSVEKHSMNRYAHLRVRKLCISLYQRVTASHCRQLMGHAHQLHHIHSGVFAVQSVAHHQILSFQSWQLHCILFFVQNFSRLVSNESL